MSFKILKGLFSFFNKTNLLPNTEQDSVGTLAGELEGIDLGDARLDRRAQQVIEQLGSKPTQSIPAACGGWTETHAAYRLFDNKKVTAEGVLSPHIACTIARMQAHPIVLCVQDTTELDYTGKPSIQGLGPLNYDVYSAAITPSRL